MHHDLMNITSPSASRIDYRRRSRGGPTSRKLQRFMSGLTLQQVSSRTGVSMRRLSDFENEKCVLSEKEEEAVRALLAAARLVEKRRQAKR
jgi:hypothetical protein